MPQQKLAFYLLKEGTYPMAAIDNADSLETIDVAPELPFTGKLFFRASKSNPATWVAYIQPCLVSPLTGLRTQSAGSILSIQVDKREFLIPFGTGYHWIDEDQIEHQFGLKVVLNSVDEDKIKSIDHEQLEYTRLKRRSQTSTISSLTNFGLDIDRDLVRAVTGIPRDKGFATSVSGSNQLVIHADVPIHDLAEKCRQALDAFRSDAYKVNYEWIDKLKRVTDPVEVATLDKILIDEIKTNKDERVYLAPPSIINSDDHIGFLYQGERGKDYRHDLRLNDYLELRKDKNISIEMLKGDRLRHFVANADNPKKISIYKCILFEHQDAGALRILTNGDWYSVDEGYVEKINAALSKIAEKNLNLIKYQSPDQEKIYNEKCMKERHPDFDLLDRKLVKFGGAYSKVEVCDLLSMARHLIHVKRGTQSSSLSHLFTQGLVSAQFLRDPGFRVKAQEICHHTHKPLFIDPYEPEKWEVVFAMITRSTKSLADTLPFFSKQSLVNAARQLSDMRYQVSIAKIGYA